MFDYEIENSLKSFEKFAGVFPRDKIPKISSYPCYIILNTDKSSEPGTHWVAMRFTETQCEYFDSFGLPPMHSEMVKAAGNRRIIWNGRCLQHPTSRTCGEFCISFVKQRIRGYSFPRFIKIFGTDTKSNDILVKKISDDAL